MPDSCCLDITPGCGKGKLRDASLTLDQHIHMHGCVTIMKRKLEEQVVPVLLGFAGVGVVLALVQLLAVVFAFSDSSSIARYRKQDDTRSFRSAGAPHPSVPSTPR